MTRFVLIFSVLLCTRATIVVVDGWIDLLVSLVVFHTLMYAFDRRDLEFLETRVGKDEKRCLGPYCLFSALDVLEITRVLVRSILVRSHLGFAQYGGPIAVMVMMKNWVELRLRGCI